MKGLLFRVQNAGTVLGTSTDASITRAAATPHALPTPDGQNPISSHLFNINIAASPMDTIMSPG